MASSIHASARQTLEMMRAESDIYNMVSRMEDQLELALKRKQQEIRENLQRANHSITATFRLYVVDISDVHDAKLRKVRVFGRVLTGQRSTGTSPCFTQLFKKVEVVLTQGENHNTHVWSKHADDELADGLEVTADTTDEYLCDVGLALYSDENDERCVLSKALGALVGCKTGSQSDVFLSLWQYIKDNELQSGQRRGYVRLDRKLSSLVPDYLRRKFANAFTRDSVKMSILLEILRANISPEAIRLKTTLAGSGDQRCFDIQVEVEDEVLRESAQEAGLFGNPESFAAQYQALKRTHQEALEQLSYHRRRRNFFTGLCENPTLFIDHFMLSQTRELAVIAGNSGRLPEEERSTKFYESRWVHEAIPEYLRRRSKQKGTSS